MTDVERLQPADDVMMDAFLREYAVLGTANDEVLVRQVMRVAAGEEVDLGAIQVTTRVGAALASHRPTWSQAALAWVAMAVEFAVLATCLTMAVVILGQISWLREWLALACVCAGLIMVAWGLLLRRFAQSPSRPLLGPFLRPPVITCLGVICLVLGNYVVLEGR